MKVIGIRHMSFKGNDGEMVSGTNLYLTEPLAKEDGEGQSCERLFLSERVFSGLTHKPRVGDEVIVRYNRYGKCADIEKAV